MSKAGVGSQNAVGTAIPNPEKCVALRLPRGFDFDVESQYPACLLTCYPPVAVYLSRKFGYQPSPRECSRTKRDHATR
jgi:hypothetical protein